MAYCRYLSKSGIAKLMEGSDSEYEDVTEYENHPSDETESSDNDFEIEIQPMHNIHSIQSKNSKLKLKLDRLPNSGQLTSANILKTSARASRYATARIRNVKCAFETIFTSTIEKEIIKYKGLLSLAGVYKSCGESTKSLWDKETDRNIIRSTMFLESFCTVSRAIHFDIKSIRQDTRSVDKIAAARNIRQKWI